MQDRPRSQVCNCLRGTGEACVSTTATKCLLTLLSPPRSQFNSTMASHLRPPSLPLSRLSCSGRRRQKSEGRGRGGLRQAVWSPPLPPLLHCCNECILAGSPVKSPPQTNTPSQPSRPSVRRRPRRFSPTSAPLFARYGRARPRRHRQR